MSDRKLLGRSKTQDKRLDFLGFFFILNIRMIIFVASGFVVKNDFFVVQRLFVLTFHPFSPVRLDKT
jgi:hypothetical protein